MARRHPVPISPCLLNQSGTIHRGSQVHCMTERLRGVSTTTKKHSTPRRTSRPEGLNGQRHIVLENHATSTGFRWAMSGISTTRLIMTTKIFLQRLFRATSSTSSTLTLSTQPKHPPFALSAKTVGSEANRSHLLELRTPASFVSSLDLHTKISPSELLTKSGITAQSVNVVSEAALIRYVKIFSFRVDLRGLLVHVQ